MAGTISRSMDEVIGVGIGLFILVLVLALTYQGQAQTQNQMVTQYGANSGVAANFTKTSGPLVNTYGNNLNLVIFALVFIAIITAILIALDRRGSGGFLGR